MQVSIPAESSCVRRHPVARVEFGRSRASFRFACVALVASLMGSETNGFVLHKPVSGIQSGASALTASSSVGMTTFLPQRRRPVAAGADAFSGQRKQTDGKFPRRQLELLRMQQKPGAVDEDMEAAQVAATDESPRQGESDQKVAPYAWFIVALLLALNIHNQWSRALVYYLVSFKVDSNPETARLYMNVDLGFGQEQYGLLASFGFTALYTLFTLVAGRVADGNNRAVVATLAAAGWSLTTAAQGLAGSFDSVLMARSVTGVSQAFLTPPAYGLIASYVPESRLATANSIYASGIYVGGALASLSILLDNQLGWRATSITAGGIGLGIAGLSALALRDKPKSAEVEQTEETPLLKEEQAVSLDAKADEPPLQLTAQAREAVTAIRTVVQSPFVQILFAASAFRFCAGYGIGVWKAPFYRQAFPSYTNEFSVANAFVISAGGVLSSILGGLIADKYAPKNPKVRLWVPAVGSLLAVPFWIGTVQANTFETSISMLFAEYIVAECWFGPALASLYKGVPKEYQGTAQGLFTVLTAVGNVMPLLIGSLQSGDASSLPSVLAWTVSGAYVMSGLAFFAASFYLPEADAKPTAVDAES